MPHFKLQVEAEASLLRFTAQTGLPGGVVSGSLMLDFNVHQFCNINVHLQVVAVSGYRLTWNDIDSLV